MSRKKERKLSDSIFYSKTLGRVFWANDTNQLAPSFPRDVIKADEAFETTVREQAAGDIRRVSYTEGKGFELNEKPIVNTLKPVIDRILSISRMRTSEPFSYNGAKYSPKDVSDACALQSMTTGLDSIVKDINGNVIRMKSTELKKLASSLLKYQLDVHTAATAHVDHVSKLSDPSTYDISQGWPK